MPPSPPPPFRNSKMASQNGTTATSTTLPMMSSAMLNALLLRHFQHNKLLSNNTNLNNFLPSSAPFPPPPAPPPLRSANNGEMLDNGNGHSTTNMFASTVDSLHSFLSPNVVLLPVAFHSLADEHHIQLLGMPQTVIPIAIHPEMQGQFSIRPLLVEHSLAGQLPIELPQKVDLVADIQDHHQQHSLFQLPIAFRSSLLSPKNPKENTQITKEQQVKSSKPLNATTIEKDSTTTKTKQDAGRSEPLDLSISTKMKPSVGNGGTANLTQPRRKRTLKMVETKEETEIEKQKKSMPSSSIAIASCSSLISANMVPHIPSHQTMPTTMDSNVSPKSTQNVPSESPPRKRFLCDLCGDVSFLAMETLIGHKKYYCRNRTRSPEEEAALLASVSSRSKTDTSFAASSSITTNPSSTVCSKKSSTISISTLNCPYCAFQTDGPDKMAQHQKLHHVQPVVCPDCGYRAYTTRGLRTHVKLSHAVNPSISVEHAGVKSKEFDAENRSEERMDSMNDLEDIKQEKH